MILASNRDTSRMNVTSYSLEYVLLDDHDFDEAQHTAR